MGDSRSRQAGLFFVGTFLLSPQLLFSQGEANPSPLILRQAITIALEKNPTHRAVLADTKVAAAGANEARSFLLPHVTFSEAATRSNDPVYVFGTKLRQNRFTSADFALNVLNTPASLGNFDTHFGGSWNLFDSFASWRGLHRETQLKEAASEQLERVDQEIVFRVIDSYYSVLSAKKQLEVAAQAVKTAQAIFDRGKNRFQAGMAVESDFLSAQVRLTGRKQEMIQAQNDLAIARAQLSAAMGLSAIDQFEAVEVLSEHVLPLISLENAEKRALEMRPDLKRIVSGEAAQHQNVLIAKSAFGPRINAFAGWDADNPSFVAGNGGSNWQAGIEVQLDLFQGGAKRAQLSRERALEEKAAALKEAATDAIRLEVRQAFYNLDSARQQMEVVRAAVAQSQESLRINQNRYEAGLVTITDLLGAEESSHRTESEYWQAVFHYYTRYANLELAAGTLNLQSPVVTP